MKKRCFYFIVCLLANIACVHPSSELTIKTNGDTINYGTDFTAELFIPYQNGFLPAFKIIRLNDTSWLPIDTIKKCAILKAASKKSGEKVFNGIVDYTDMKGNKKSEKFSIRYYVKSRPNDSI
jgi:hypothetical protein